MKSVHKSIIEINGTSFIVNHKKTLLFSLIETLSKTVYPGESNKNKFINFISDFCMWEEYDRVSIQQLKYYMDKIDSLNITLYSNLITYINETLSEFPKSTPVPFSIDPTVETINSFIPSSQGNINGKKINLFTHGELIWRYRNALVHEARSLGTTEMFKYEQPHYVPFTYIDSLDDKISVSDKYFVICYPLNFLNTLIDVGIDNLEKHLILHNINPYDTYSLENLWVD